ncbi:F-box protein [Senna tora]|uniref:F-box protein n=1 Tax=Senna tora TaxID=362788 RepID=A0A834TNH3_9FABA|nr:F-box protein [Senna tora]
MDDSFSDHKLCGFLFAVLSVTPSPPDPSASLGFKHRCDIFGDSSGSVGFRSQNGVVLVPVDSLTKQIEGADARASDSEQCKVAGRDSGLVSDCNGKVTPRGLRKKGTARRKNGVVAGGGSLKKRRMTKIGMVNGSVSVIHQLQALVSRKCLKIDARVISVELGGCEEARAVLLVDVYLPVALWSGWQFPRNGSTAGALFRHLRCDWGERRLMLSCSDYCRKTEGASESIWNLSDCHVLGCKLHYHVNDSSKNNLFELHEIFKKVPGVGKQQKSDSSRIIPLDNSSSSGIWEISDDILIKILAPLDPMDLARVSATCRHLRSSAASVMPCTKLKLFPHQQAAVEWMLHRERNAECLAHPLYVSFSTEDGFIFHVNTVSGEIVIGAAPTIKDFRGGMFCDEPGLGKTVTALSLIMKKQGALADPPDGAKVVWCQHNGNQKCGYYDIIGNYIIDSSNLGKRDMFHDACRNSENHDDSSKRTRLMVPVEQITGLNSCSREEKKTPVGACSDQLMHASRCSWSLSSVKKGLHFTYEEEAGFSKDRKFSENSSKLKNASDVESQSSQNRPADYTQEKGYKKPGKPTVDFFECNDTWIQCDACHKWRKLADANMANTNAAWFCSMNTDPLYQSCSVPEQSWHNSCEITYLPGFHLKGTAGGEKQNVSFFTGVLKEHHTLINSETKKALTWLARLSPDRLAEIEINGIRGPILNTCTVSTGYLNPYHKIFQAFGLIKRLEKGVSKWYYPQNLNNLAFDVNALGLALREPLDSVRLYLSRATLIVVPANLVDHWIAQIEKHVKPSQLRVYVWTDHWRPSVHSLAWNYDVVITTFSRLSAEWSPRKRSVLMQVHWLRIMLDEGHTLGSSLNLTNKLQMAISLTASNRWILTGTPTPNTPKSQLSHLQPLLRFLHEEAYGQNHKSWEAGILKPFEAEMEEGRSRLLHLLHNCMISARKIDLHSIPPCIKKAVFLDFAEEHARSYNELVLTVRRNVLMADWNDPSHVESLLNPKQWKFRSATIKNVRLSCCVAGHIKVTHAGEDIQETMDMLVESGLDPESGEYASIRYNLVFGGHCVRCKEWCRLPFITPCRHLLCLDCVALDSTRCTYPGCSKLYEMQSPDTLARPENPNPKWPVVSFMIPVQDSDKSRKFPTKGKMRSQEVKLLKLILVAQMTNLLKHEHPARSLLHLPISWFNMHMGDSMLILFHFSIHIHFQIKLPSFGNHGYGKWIGPIKLLSPRSKICNFETDASRHIIKMFQIAQIKLDNVFEFNIYSLRPFWVRRRYEYVDSTIYDMSTLRHIYVAYLTISFQIINKYLCVDESRVAFDMAKNEQYIKIYKYTSCIAHVEGYVFGTWNYEIWVRA